TFSPGGDLSMVLYDKVLQGRLSGKRHMEPLWAASGWQPGVSVTRHEARLRRPAVREVGLVGEARSCLDDPWECLTHLTAIFAAGSGPRRRRELPRGGRCGLDPPRGPSGRGHQPLALADRSRLAGSTVCDLRRRTPRPAT